MNPTMEDPFARDPLAARLARLAVPPAPRDLASRAVTGAATVRRSRRRWPGLAAGALALAGVAATVAFSPALPLIGGGAREWVGRYGTRAIAPPAQATSVTSSGYTVRLVTVYDDGNRVVLTLRIDGVHAGFRTVNTISDAGGNRLNIVTSGPARGRQTELGDYVLVARRPAGGARAGTDLTLHLTQIGLFNKAPETTVNGDWTLRFHATAARAPRPLPVPAAGSAGGVSLDFTSVHLTDDYLDIGFTGRGTYRSFAELKVELYDPRGNQAAFLDSSGQPAVLEKGGVPGKSRVVPADSKGRPTPVLFDPDATTTAAEDWAWDLHGRGTYRLVISSWTDPSVRMERDIVVSEGAAGANLPPVPAPAGSGAG